MLKKYSWLLSVILIFTINAFADNWKEIDINWGDGTPHMVIKSGDKLTRREIEIFGKKQIVRYKDEWVDKGNNLIYHWIDETGRPRHRFIKSGAMTIETLVLYTDPNKPPTYSKKTVTVPEPPASSTNDPDKKYEALYNARYENRAERMYRIKTPLTNKEDGPFFYPGKEHTLVLPEPAIIPPNNPGNWELKRIEWQLYNPWERNMDPPPTIKYGGEVKFTFYVPNSSLNRIPDNVNPPDGPRPHYFTSGVRLFFHYIYTGNPVHPGSMLIGDSTSTLVFDTAHYCIQRAVVYVIDVKDPADDSLKDELDFNIETDNTDLKANGNVIYTGELLKKLYIKFKDDNPNLLPDDVACSFGIYPAGFDNSDGSGNVYRNNRDKTIMSFEKLTLDISGLTVYPQPGSEPTTKPANIEDVYYSISEYYLEDRSKLKRVPFNLKGNFKGVLFPMGYVYPHTAISRPFANDNTKFKIYDDKAPLIFFHISDKAPAEYETRLPGPREINRWYFDKHPSETTAYHDYEEKNIAQKQYHEFNKDILTKEAEWAVNTFDKASNKYYLFEDTRYFLEIYTPDNVKYYYSATNPAPQIAWPHLSKITWTLKKLNPTTGAYVELEYASQPEWHVRNFDAITKKYSSGGKKVPWIASLKKFGYTLPSKKPESDRFIATFVFRAPGDYLMEISVSDDAGAYGNNKPFDASKNPVKSGTNNKRSMKVYIAVKSAYMKSTSIETK